MTTADLFVYGTLMPHAASRYGQAQRERLRCEARVLGRATACARLYDLGEYPGLVPSTDPMDATHGVALRIANPAATLPWLDAYEGIQPGRDCEYERILLPVRLAGGTLLSCWVYVWRRPLSGERWLQDGEWPGASAA